MSVRVGETSDLLESCQIDVKECKMVDRKNTPNVHFEYKNINFVWIEINYICIITSKH